MALYHFSKKRLRNLQIVDTDSDCGSDRSDDDDLEALKSETYRNLPLKDGSGYLTLRKKRKIITLCNFSRITVERQYFREQIMLYTAWRSEPLLESDLEKIFNDCLKEINQNKKIL